MPKTGDDDQQRTAIVCTCGPPDDAWDCALHDEEATIAVSMKDLLTVLDAWFQADFGHRDACLAAERLASSLGLDSGSEGQG